MIWLRQRCKLLKAVSSSLHWANFFGTDLCNEMRFSVKWVVKQLRWKQLLGYILLFTTPALIGPIICRHISFDRVLYMMNVIVIYLRFCQVTLNKSSSYPAMFVCLLVKLLVHENPSVTFRVVLPVSRMIIFVFRFRTTQTKRRASTNTRWHFAFALCGHSNATRAPIANPPHSVQLGGIPYIPYHSPKLHTGLCSSVGIRPRTDRHTDARDEYIFHVV